MGPAPAQMAALAGDARLAFHTRVAVYGTPAASGMTLSTNAALGENVPAKPPDSFHATTLPLTAIATSWLKPATEVNRSTLPVRIECEATEGVNETVRLVASMGCQVTPSLAVSVYCCVVCASITDAADSGSSTAVKRVGEKLGSMGPAPAHIAAVAPAGLLAFHCSFSVYVIPDLR